ncbi:PREDICTED: cell cycle checkpoint protein RAD1 isoform X2 [Polistes dominula]|uniref:Cell cycle checkpoint protein RAD1 isoform X2 n=1 Tax=Polistes dominula TaxID=743375 RepID=A0ABM1IGZ5_POLDO|nr:PREDICTED: cell cycle checkpoint protein RAD1 isoform X2 [Polistes dominula]
MVVCMYRKQLIKDFTPNPYSVKYNEIVDHLLKESVEDFEKNGKFSDKILLKLYNVFGEVFERALELYEEKRVTHISSSTPVAKGDCYNKNNARWLLQVKGFSGIIYTLFPEINFCTCLSFRNQVIDNRVIFTCKHVLACWLATIDKEKLLYQQITSQQFQHFLLYQSFSNHTATCFATENGIKVTVEDAKCMQANAYISKPLFVEYYLKEDGIGNPLSVVIEENGVITDCSLKTQNPEGLLDFYLEEQNVYSRVVLKTELLKDILTELDPTSEIIELLLSPEEPFFRISTNGLAGICHIELPHDGDMIENFKCQAAATTKYKLAHIKPAMKALSCAYKTSLRTDTCGLLCFQYMIKTEEGNVCYVEYYISPVIDMD